MIWSTPALALAGVALVGVAVDVVVGSCCGRGVAAAAARLWARSCSSPDRAATAAMASRATHTAMNAGPVMSVCVWVSKGGDAGFEGDIRVHTSHVQPEHRQRWSRCCEGSAPYWHLQGIGCQFCAYRYTWHEAAADVPITTPGWRHSNVRNPSITWRSIKRRARPEAGLVASCAEPHRATPRLRLGLSTARPPAAIV